MHATLNCLKLSSCDHIASMEFNLNYQLVFVPGDICYKCVNDIQYHLAEYLPSMPVLQLVPASVVFLPKLFHLKSNFLVIKFIFVI